MDLDIKRVLAARPGAPEKVELNKLTTTWGEELDDRHVLDEYPRPHLRRAHWTCLNGWWQYAIVESSEPATLWRTVKPPVEWDGSILVPFSPEASLSGVGRQLLPTQYLWYRTAVELRAPASDRALLLHFGAVDYACAVHINGKKICEHVGGYLPFYVDVSDVVRDGINIVTLCVYDPSEHGTQLRGKQRIRRGNMWYTAQSGIWQTVWMEEVSARHVCEVGVHAGLDDGNLALDFQLSEAGESLAIEVLDASGQTVAKTERLADDRHPAIILSVPNPHAWDINDPYLYQLRIAYGEDTVESYAAFRTVGVEPDEQGVLRFCLNHKPLFLRGLLDQGYWPDGLMTPPSDEAFIADIQAAREAGFNMLRKHIKIEPERWYWHCDRLGILVWQDMVSGGDIPEVWTSANIPTLFRHSWTFFRDDRPKSWARLGASDAAYREEWLSTARSALRLLGSHPCIATWIVFNESWGQFESARMTEELRAVDNTRPFVSTSGWYDQGAGDYVAVHNYFRDMRVYKHKGNRAFVINEFGGLTCPIEGHTSVDTVYGYDTYEDIESWRAALRELLDAVDALEAEGLAGYVYTQVSDVEEESNGILTYDRRVNKLFA